MTANVHYFPLINSLITLLFSLPAPLKPPNYLCLTPLNSTFLLMLCVTLTRLAKFYKFSCYHFLLLRQSLSFSMAATLTWETSRLSQYGWQYSSTFSFLSLSTLSTATRKSIQKSGPGQTALLYYTVSLSFLCAFDPCTYPLHWCPYTTCGYNKGISITG